MMEQRFYVPLDTKQIISGTFLLSQSFGFLMKKVNLNIIRMWTNAQRDGRPAEYIGSALCSTPQSLADAMESRAVTLPRRETH